MRFFYTDLIMLLLSVSYIFLQKNITLDGLKDDDHYKNIYVNKI
jgi:hypothetical protein